MTVASIAGPDMLLPEPGSIDTGSIDPASIDALSPAEANRTQRNQRRWKIAGLLSVLVAAVVVVLVVVNNAAMLSNAARSARTASPWWLLVTALAMAVSFVAAAIGTVGAVQGRVPVRRTMAVEYAGTFCNRLTPAGLGRTALRARYLVCAGLSCERAASAVALTSIVGAITYVGGMAAAGVVMQNGTSASITVSPGNIALLGVSVALAAVAALEVSCHRWRRSARRKRWTTRARTLGRELRALAHDPRAMSAVVGGSVFGSAAYVIAFWAALHSVGVPIGLTSAALVYVTSTAVAAAVPIPGGVGAAEFTLTAGLVTAGFSPGASLSGVLIFRLFSLWLPSAVGAGTLLWLRRIGALTHSSDPVVVPASRPAGRTTAAAGARGASAGRGRGRLVMPRKLLVAGGALAAVTAVGAGVALTGPDPSATVVPVSAEAH